MKSKYIMNSYVWPAFVGMLVMVSACKKESADNESLTVICLEDSFKNPQPLHASDFFTQIRYLVLETSDSCLVGDDPVIEIAKDKVIVMTAQQQCFVFDKETGRFLRSVGHVGDDPEACRDLKGNLDYAADLLYFPSNKYLELSVYNLENRFIRTQQAYYQTDATGIAPMEYDYFDGESLLIHAYATQSSSDQILCLRDSSLLFAYPTHSEPANPHVPYLGMPNVLTVETEGTAGHTLFSFFDEKKTFRITSENGSPFWHVGEETFFKANFNDTIYQVESSGLVPRFLLNSGDYSWPLEERLSAHKDGGFFYLNFLENDKILFFRFCRHLLHPEIREAYNALYNKQNGQVKISPYEDGLVNDLTHFLPLQPSTANADGEFAQLLQPYEILAWFEENPSAQGLREDIEQLRTLDEEDNPIIVIMK